MDSREPLVSVIVPVYNGQNYLENCIRSIEGQTYRNLEVIIINDGSSDGTADVCDALLGDYDNVRVIATDDLGVSAARNAGLDKAEGELVAFVDADDRLHPDMLRMLSECMTRTESDIVGCRFFEWRDETEWEQAVRMESAEEQAVTYDADAYLRECLLQGNSRCWSKLYRMETIGGMRFREGLSIGEDMLFVLKVLARADRITEMDYQGYGYCQNPQGAINRAFTPRYMDQITCWRLAREEVRRLDESLDGRVCALYLMGIMLTAGKLAGLPAARRKRYEDCILTCHRELKEVKRVPGACAKLSAGYRLKVFFFSLFPHGYLCAYHLWRNR